MITVKSSELGQQQNFDTGSGANAIDEILGNGLLQ
jgi:hypothetical protein